MPGKILYKEIPWKFRSNRCIGLIPGIYGFVLMTVFLIMGISKQSLPGIILPSLGLIIIVPGSIYSYWAQRGFYIDKEGIQFPKTNDRYIFFKDIETVEIKNIRPRTKRKVYGVFSSYMEITMKNGEVFRIEKGYSYRDYGTYDFKILKEIIYREWRACNQ